MLGPDKQRLLSGFLGQLPEQVAARLAKAIEVDRLCGGAGLPHDAILNALRPQLRQRQQTVRLATPQRYFCQPFEDFLVGPERAAKQKGRIARSSITPVWDWLANHLMPARHRELAEAIREAILHNRDSEIEEKSVQLWAESASALKSATADEKKMIAAAKKLGGMAIAQDAAEIGLILSGAEEMEALQKRLPKPIINLGEDDVAMLRETFDRLGDSIPDLAVYVPLLVLGRLERPWEVLRVTSALSRKMTDTMIANTDIGVVGDLLFSDLDWYVKQIQTARPASFDSDAVLASLANFAELSSGIVKELGIRRDGKWGQRLAKDRGAVSKIIEPILERAPREILAALPTIKTGAFAKNLRPLDFSHQPDPALVEKARRYAQLAAHSRPFAAAAAFSAKLNEVLDETAEALRTYGEDVVREIRTGSAEQRANVDAHFALLLELSALILGEEETSLLRRRARVPANA